MKKLTLLLLLAAMLATGCSKKEDSGGYCYTCKIGMPGNAYYREKDTCSNTPATAYRFTDPLGNSQTYICTEK